jgi:hypothetical protein
MAATQHAKAKKSSMKNCQTFEKHPTLFISPLVLLGLAVNPLSAYQKGSSTTDPIGIAGMAIGQ